MATEKVVENGYAAFTDTGLMLSEHMSGSYLGGHLIQSVTENIEKAYICANKESVEYSIKRFNDSHKNKVEFTIKRVQRTTTKEVELREVYSL